jgi:hypothetical protein
MYLYYKTFTYQPSRPLLPASNLPWSQYCPGSRISDPGSRIQKQQQNRGVKKISCHNFLCSHKFHKIANYFSFEVVKKKIWANFQRIIELFTQNIVTKLSKIWIWYPGSEIQDPRSGIQDPRSGIQDPGSGKKLFRIPDPGVKKAPDPGSATLLGAVPLVLQAKNRQENISCLRLQACVFLPDVQVVQPSKRGCLHSADKTAPPIPSRPSLLLLLHLYGSKLSAAASPSKALLSLQIRRLLHHNICTLSAARHAPSGASFPSGALGLGGGPGGGGQL